MDLQRLRAGAQILAVIVLALGGPLIWLVLVVVLAVAFKRSRARRCDRPGR